jgi:uncharacterized protein YvpB
MRRRLASVVILTAILLLCAAALAAGSANLWLDVPFVPQQKEGCGAASIAMIMQYWEQLQNQPMRPESSPQKILGALYSKPAHGIYASAMLRYFQQNGYRAFEFAGNEIDLERELHFGRPLIVALKSDSGSSLHYVVVVGLDAPQQFVIVNDPAQRKLLKEQQSEFDRQWKAAESWTLLAVPGTSKN